MKISVISLARMPERRRRIVAELEALGLDHEIRDAVDGQALPEAEKACIDWNSSREDGRPVRLGSVANWISQCQVLREMVTNGPELTAILEDDVELSPEFPDVLAALETRRMGIGIVFLHHGPEHRRFIAGTSLSTGHRLGWVRWSHFGSQGYVITRAAAARFLEMNSPVRSGIDRALARYWHHGLPTNCIRPAVVRQRQEFAGRASAIAQAPELQWSDPFASVRRVWFHASEGYRKRVSLTRIVCRAHGPVNGLLQIARPDRGTT